MHRIVSRRSGNYFKLWKLVLAAETIAIAGCSLSRATRIVAALPAPPVAGEQAAPPAALQNEVELLLRKLEAAYAEVEDYQTEVETLSFDSDGAVTTESCLYTFKKPKRIRIDFISPHPGMVAVYPDADAKVLVRPAGLISILAFHLELNDPLLESPTAQQIDQTDLGLLIANIRHSVTEQRRGPISISEAKATIAIQVLADDHFRRGVETNYRYWIDKQSSLPSEVDAFAADATPEWKIIFRNLRTNRNVPDSLFQ